MLIRKNIKLYLFDILALISGLIFPLAFAPFHIYPIAFISPFLLLLSWTFTSPKRAAFRGWLFGMAEFSIGISWVYISIHVYGQASVFLSVLITAVFVFYLSLFPALQGYLLNRFFSRDNFVKWILVYPSSWVVFELLRTWLFTGFPWLLLGYSQVGTIYQGFAPLIGVYGVSFMVVMTAASFFYLLQNLRRLQIIGFGLAFFVFLGFSATALCKINWTLPIGPPLSTALIQGNIKQELKWHPDQMIKTLNLYLHYSKLNLDKNVIIWPEAAITLPQTEMKEFLTQLDRMLLRNGSAVITGIPILDSHKIYNGIIAVGNGSGLYTKRHLVPFGEYIPLKTVFHFVMNSFDIPMSDVAAGPAKQKPLRLKNILIAPYICYEIAYPLEFLSFLPNANLLLTITDDSWFGKSIASAQHVQMGQMRSIETGRYLLFSGNTGITAIINPKGVIEKMIPPFEENVLTGRVYAMSGQTPWVKWKMVPLLGLIAFSVLLGRRSQSAITSP